jgi:putative endonuclease
MAPSDNDYWYVYIIECENNTLYTGITTSVQRRFLQHKQGKGSKYFRSSPPRKIVFIEAHPNRSQATMREIAIKKLSKLKKIELINNQSNSVPGIKGTIVD